MPASLPPPPPHVDLTASRTINLYIGSAVTYFFACSAVGLRIWSRRLRGRELWLDDFFCLVGFLSCTALTAIAFWAATRGQGVHIWAAPPDAARSWALSLFMAEFAYTFTLAFVKWSILAFYWRTFHIVTAIRISTYIIASIVGCWFVAVLTVALIQCKPISAYWMKFDPVNPATDYTCSIDEQKYFLGNSGVTILTDLAILALPLRHILTLRMRLLHRLGIAFMFSLGIFLTIVSCVRITFVMRVDPQDPDITWNFLDINVWSIVEGNIAVVTCCLPFLKPVVERCFKLPRVLRTTQHYVKLPKLPDLNKIDFRHIEGEKQAAPS